MSKVERSVTVMAGLALPAALVVGAMMGQMAALVIGGLAILAAWRYVPGIWRTIGTGLLGGAIAGVLVLGPGFRLAMRVVAILDPERQVEFSLGGTFLIVVLIGVILGGALGVLAALLRKGLGWSGLVMAGVMTFAVVGLLLLDTGLRSELVELGAGPWLNIPMFTAVSFVYGLLANRLIDRFEVKRSRQTTIEPVEVPT